MRLLKKYTTKLAGNDGNFACKNKYPFDKLKDYITRYFKCPSVEIALVDVDIINKCTDEKKLFAIDKSICETVEAADQKRLIEINKILPEHNFIRK